MTHRRKEHTKLNKEMGREHDQEIHRCVLDNLIEEHSEPESSEASSS